MLNPYLKQARKTKEELVLEHVSNVKHIARRLSARLPPNIELDDLVQAGMIGLMEAADKYDPAKETKFKTFAELRIKGAMLDDLRSKDWIPRSVRDNANKLDRAYSSLRNDGIDNPTDVQLAGYFGMKLKEYDEFLTHTKPIPLLSLDGSGDPHGGDEGSLQILDTVADPDDKDQMENLLGEEAKNVLAECLKKLPEKEQLVLSLYYNEDLNLKEIGAVLDISESRISQIRTKAIAMLRSYMKDY